MKRLIRQTLASSFAGALCGGLFFGCAATHELRVNSVSRPPAREATSYKLKTKVPPGEADSLRVQEATGVIKTALSGRGLYEAPDEDHADMIVEVDFGIEAPHVRMEVTRVPVYAQTGGGVRYEQVEVRDAKGAVSSRTVPVLTPPNTEMVGYDEVLTPVNVYEKYLRISARENKPETEGKRSAEIWSVSVKREDDSKDLRKYLPILASASATYIGKETKTEQVVKIADDDPAVVFVKKGL